jgi:hypothetical protein
MSELDQAQNSQRKGKTGKPVAALRKSTSSLKDSSRWMALGDATWSLDAPEVLPLDPREVVVFGKSWLVHSLPTLVPISLVEPQMESSGGTA